MLVGERMEKETTHNKTNRIENMDEHPLKLSRHREYSFKGNMGTTNYSGGATAPGGKKTVKMPFFTDYSVH